MSNPPLPAETAQEYLRRIGARGGSKNSDAQAKARKLAKNGAGRPKGSKNKNTATKKGT